MVIVATEDDLLRCSRLAVKNTSALTLFHGSLTQTDGAASVVSSLTLVFCAARCYFT